MINELISFTTFIKEKTKITLSLCNEQGIAVVGKEKITPDIAYKGVVQDRQSNITYFPIKLKGTLFYGVISGSGEPEKTYALFISQLAEDFFVAEKEMTKVEFYKATLIGGISYSQGLKYAEKYKLPNLPCYAIIVSFASKNQDFVFDVLSNYCDDGQDVTIKLGENKIVIIKYVGNKQDYRSITEFAEFIYRTVYEETGISLKIYTGGEVSSVLDISQSYSQAENVERICLSISAKGDVHSFRDVTFVRVLEDLPKHKIKEYLASLLTDEAREIFDDKEMLATAEEFLESNLSISETSRKMYLHRNTLAYRLDKIEKGTGLNIRKFADAMTFKMIKFMQKIAE